MILINVNSSKIVVEHVFQMELPSWRLPPRGAVQQACSFFLLVRCRKYGNASCDNVIASCKKCCIRRRLAPDLLLLMRFALREWKIEVLKVLKKLGSLIVDVEKSKKFDDMYPLKKVWHMEHINIILHSKV
jgi:hypothetical protein